MLLFFFPGKRVACTCADRECEERSHTSVGAEGDAMLALQGDVRQFDSVAKAVQATVDRFGRLDILVNNAAGNFLCPAKDLSSNGFKTGTPDPTLLD